MIRMRKFLFAILFVSIFGVFYFSSYQSFRFPHVVPIKSPLAPPVTVAKRAEDGLVVKRIPMVLKQTPISARIITTATVTSGPSAESNGDSKVQAAFKNIYSKASWGRFGGKAYSGDGSTPWYTKKYRKFLESFFIDNHVTSVLDAPCGLWTFAQLIDWGPVRSYIGADIVPYVIQENIKIADGKFRDTHPNTSFEFRVQSLTASDLPHAQLLIAKDVLQHLPNSMVHKVLQNIFPIPLSANDTTNSTALCKFKYALITNDLCNQKSLNKNIAAGSYRYLDIRKPPFNVKSASEVFKFAFPGCKTTLLLNFTQPEWNCQFDE